MQINSAKLIYFSPTGTTRKVIEGIVQGVHIDTVEHIDLTSPDPKKRKIYEMHEELTIIGSPVYGGRLPFDMISRLQRFKGNDTPAVIVVVYGNRAYEDALLELRDLALGSGFHPIAAGAFIGEHSYSNNDTPIAVGRPDTEDLRKAKEFGEKIHEKLEKIGALDEMPLLRVPGNFPYKELQMLSNIAPVTQQTECTQCGECMEVCPTAAITVGETVVTDRSLCIRCCACVKICPSGARVMADQRMRQIAEKLSTTCHERKEPETYL
jgi:ferredoxin